MLADRLTLAQIATSSLAAAGVLERHGIDYYNGPERHLGEVCSEQGLDFGTVADELSSAVDEPVDDRDWTTEPLPQLIRFLLEEHATIRVELKVVQTRLHRLAGMPNGLYTGTERLPHVFDGLVEDIHVHMSHEEADVFPAISRWVEAAEKGTPEKGSPLSSFGGPIRLVEAEHESNGAALRLMREFARNYEVPPDANSAYHVLVKSMIALEDRLLRHVYLENTVLFPRAAALKPRRQSATSG